MICLFVRVFLICGVEVLRVEVLWGVDVLWVVEDGCVTWNWILKDSRR